MALAKLLTCSVQSDPLCGLQDPSLCGPERGVGHPDSNWLCMAHSDDCCGACPFGCLVHARGTRLTHAGLPVELLLLVSAAFLTVSPRCLLSFTLAPPRFCQVHAAGHVGAGPGSLSPMILFFTCPICSWIVLPFAQVYSEAGDFSVKVGGELTECKRASLTAVPACLYLRAVAGRASRKT